MMFHKTKHSSIQVAALRQYLVVEFDCAVLKLSAHEFNDSIIIVRARYHYINDDESAGVDERVTGNAARPLEIDNGVERITRRLATDPLEHRVADAMHRNFKCQYLGDALDWEGGGRLSGGEDGILGRDRYAERSRPNTRVLGFRCLLDSNGVFRNLGCDLVNYILQIHYT
ncbi:hypothetical protein C8J42_11723 [Sphingomonas sp. PP-CE-1A-559]|nr:hypothetical protein C8J42_11723 [Sphingomonas sp. PP-CE-1A-559]